MFFKPHHAYLALLEILGTYILGYGYACLYIFHALENYPNGKGTPRQDYIAKATGENQNWN